MATGLLVLMTGKATRLAPFLSGADKTYRGILRLGDATDTYDRAGTPTRPPRPVAVAPATLMAARSTRSLLSGTRGSAIGSVSVTIKILLRISLYRTR